MKKEHLDLENGTVWIPDSKTINGVAEVPLTDIAIEAFRRQLAISGPGPYLFPSEENPENIRRRSRQLGARRCVGQEFRISDLRSQIDIRHPAERVAELRTNA